MAFKPVSSQVDLAALEDQTIKYWKENQIFEKSIESKPEDKKWTFLDGPPFVTGLPHYGSLLSSMPKDLFARFWTMKGYRVRRVWGWDGHGLPIENKVENALEIKRKKDIEDVIGVKKFIGECWKYVEEVSDEWEWYIDHIGRWVDFEHAYKTWDKPYMESVMWVFKQMYEKGHIYKGLRVSLFCPHCSTPISNFEVAMDAENYKDVTEASNTYKYQLKLKNSVTKNDGKTYFLAWSTTPWNKLATPALAVNPKLDYVKVSQDGESYILAKTTLKMLKDSPYKIVQEMKGEDLLGLEFELHYDFYLKDAKPNDKSGVIIGGDFVTADDGTGIVTIAAYGEDDLSVMQRDHIQIVLHVDEEGTIKSDVPKFGGLYYLKANSLINQDLEERGLLYDEKSHQHSVPTCWRCHTRLFYAPQNAWYVNIQDLKAKLKNNNDPVNWFPKHFKNGRFLKSMEAAPDWCISRSRYWGSPVPVWECSCGERFVPGSIQELEDRSGQKISDLHKPEIDEVTIKCAKCGLSVKRVPEVLDSWIEAGSASFAERHFPFDPGQKLEDFFPPDFIAEYTGQIRAWFYVLHVISTAIYDTNAFKNVVVTGVILGTDGRKMSKNFGNYPDPKELMSKYGGDALRIYLMGSPVMKGEDISFSNDGVPDVTRNFLLILWNSYKYFVDYASIYDWKCDKLPKEDIESNLTILDKWILAKLTRLVLDVKDGYEGYDTVKVTKLLREFVTDDLSTWYIRRSRSRISGSDELSRNVALSVLYGCLVVYSKILAPLAPFISEEIYRNLTDDESVHLTDFPLGDKTLLNEELILGMQQVRLIVEAGHAKRKESNIKLRQPLASLIYHIDQRLTPELESIIEDELNVKKVEYKKSSGNLEVELDTNITPQLKKEGEARDLIRQIQQLRKEMGLTLKDQIVINAPDWPTDFEEMILKLTSGIKIFKADSVNIEKIT